MSSQFKITSIFLLTITFLMNCKKEKPEGCWDGSTTIIKEHSLDTIKPSDYIMAYPDSWWEYDNGRIDSCFEWFPQKTYTFEKDGNCTNVFEELQYMPRTSFGIIKENSVIAVVNSNNNTQYIFWTDTTKNLGELDRWSSGNQSYRVIKLELLEKLDSIVVSGTKYYDIIHCIIDDKTTFIKYPGAPNTKFDYYFAKNIGIIKKSSSRNPFTPYYSDTARLINHYIAPH